MPPQPCAGAVSAAEEFASSSTLQLLVRAWVFTNNARAQQFVEGRQVDSCFPGLARSRIQHVHAGGTTALQYLGTNGQVEELLLRAGSHVVLAQISYPSRPLGEGDAQLQQLLTELAAGVHA